MLSASVRTFVVLICAQVVSAAGAAEAQPRTAAPITYASLEANLAGGADRSYGYGAARSDSSSAPMDLRRGAASAPARTPAASSGQGRPAWLEQERVGAPYQVAGRTYVPAAEPGYEMVGQASWYGPQFHGQATASGEPFDQEAMTAAHPTLPLNSLVQVTNLENGREVILRVNDRGPFVGDRLIDVSHRAAEVLGFDRQGQARVNVRYLGPAPRHVTDGAEQAQIVASTEQRREIASSAGPMSLLPSPAPVPQTQTAAGAPMEFAPLPDASAPAVATSVSYTVQSQGYFVQVGAFSDPDNAHRVEAAVRSAGQVQVDARASGQGQLYRVRIGPFAGREEAAAAQRALADLGYGETILAAR